LSQDPVDSDGPENDKSEIQPSAEAALEPPPEAGQAEQFERRARLAEDRLTEVLTAYRKVKTENEGFRDRVARDVERTFNRRHEKLLVKFIDILDNLDRALEAAEQTYAGNPLIEGLILVRTQLLQTLQEEGLERIPAIGRPFDPNFAEAVETRLVDDPDDHHVVVKELMRGYRLNGRVARAARVVLGEYAGPAPSTSAPAGDRDEAPLAALADETPGEPFNAEDEPPRELPPDAADAPGPGEGGPSLEEIIARAEAQEALFPEAFDEDAPTEKDPK
jgi:molecular chaperone GrpE